MTDIAEVMARAVSDHMCDAHGIADDEEHWRRHKISYLEEIKAALAALDKAGYVVVKKEDIDGSHHEGCTCGYCA